MLRLIQKSFLVLLSIALLLALSEITIRSLRGIGIYFYDIEMSRYAVQLKMESSNPQIGHVHRPNAKAHLMGVDININSDGLRDDEYTVARTNKSRIIFLGDSLTLGWGVPKEKTFEHLLEIALSKTAPTEILNFGTGNYNTSQETYLFLEKGLKYYPDKVVVFYFINDAEPTPKRSKWGWLENSNAVTFFWSRFRTIQSRFTSTLSFRTYYSNLYQDGGAGWEQTKSALHLLKQVCEQKGIELTVFLLVDLHSLKDYPFKKEHEKILNFLSANKITAYDLAPCFTTEPNPRSLWVSLDDAHPNAKAHALIAKCVYKFLKDEVL
jgi:lysophospholipase L1-like esterase